MAIQIERDMAVGGPPLGSNFESLAIVRSPEEEQRAKKRFGNMGDHAEWLIRAKLGTYPANHQVSQYAVALTERLNGANGEKHGVTVYKGEPNAFVFPNGSTYISDQLLALADTEEELLFVLMHEKIHHQEAHSEQVFNRVEDAERSYRQKMLEGVGMSRIHEWEGDARAFVQLDNLGINPEGGLGIMNKFRKDEKFSGGVAHGKSTDRHLNLRAITHLKDLKTLGTPQHEIPGSVKDAITVETDEKKFTAYNRQFLDHMGSSSHFKAMEVLESMDLEHLLVTLPDLKKMHDRNLKYSTHQRDRYSQAALFQKKYIPEIGKRIWEKLHSSSTQAGQLDTEQTTMLFHTVLATVMDLAPEEYQDVLFDPNLQVEGADKKPLTWSKNNFSFTSQITVEEDIEKYIKSLNPDIIKGLGVKLAETPYKLVHTVVGVAMDNFVFEPEDSDFQVDKYLEFTQKLTDAFSAVYDQHDAAGFDRDETFGQIVEEGYEYLGKNDKEALEIKAHEIKPEAFINRKKQEEQTTKVEKENTEKLTAIFIDFAQEFEKYNKSRPIPLLMDKGAAPQKQFETSAYLEDVKQVFEGRNFETKEDLLVFIANFRKTIQDDRELKRLDDFSNDHWNSLIEPVIGKVNAKFEAAGSFPSQLDRAFFDFKIALLIANNPVSGILEPSSERNFTEFFKHEELTLEWFRKFYGLATTDNAVGKELGIEVENEKVMGVGLNYNEGWPEIFKAGKIRLLHQSFQSSSREEFSQFLESVTNEFPFSYYGDAMIRDDYGNTLKQEATYRRDLMKEVFETYSFDLNNVQNLKDLYYLSTYFEDQGLSIRMQNVAWKELSKLMSFDEGFAFLEQELEAKRLLSLRAVSEFVENNARTHEEIESASQKLLGLLTQESSFEGIGKLVIAEQLVTRFFLDDKFEMLIAGIGNSEDDSYLKRYLYRKWVGCMDYDEAETRGNVHLPDLMQKLYRLDAQSKYVFIRDLLTGEKGILTDPDVEKRVQFVNFFLDNYIEVNGEEDQRFFTVIKQVLDQVARSADYDLLYFAISPLIQDRFLIHPSDQASWEDIIRFEEPPVSIRTIEGLSYDTDECDEDDDDEGSRSGNGRDYYDLDEHGEIWGDRIYQKPEVQAKPTIKNYVPNLKAGNEPKVDEDGVKELYGYITGSEDNDLETEKSENIRRVYETQVEQLIEGFEEKKGKVKMTVNEFILETAQKLGAPGVRFLQLVGQYIDLPPHLEASFNEVYDKVSGQSKITADQTLLREWPGGRTTLRGLDSRLGGGSLMSVFQTKTELGQDLAVKVLNPNSSYHTDNTHSLLSNVFGVLTEQNPAFASATTLLTDIKEWIKNDIDFTDFIKQDQRFRRKHDGYSVPGNKYSIGVPHSYKPENKYFALEDYVEGTNLTQIESLQEQGHDPRQIVSLLTKNFFEQVKDGQVHSDIHPGNIRVTPDNKVVFLDRNYYLNFSVGERLFLWNLSRNLGNTQRATSMSLDHLISNGATIDQETRNRLLIQANELDTVEDPTQRLMKLAVILRKENLRFPIKTTLLIKDMFYLDRMAKKAGLSGIADALQSK